MWKTRKPRKVGKDTQSAFQQLRAAMSKKQRRSAIRRKTS